MKKSIVAAIACVAVLSTGMLAGCGSDDNAKDADDGALQITDTSVIETSEPATPAQPDYTVEAGDAQASDSFILENGLKSSIHSIALKSADSNTETADQATEIAEDASGVEADTAAEDNTTAEGNTAADENADGFTECPFTVGDQLSPNVRALVRFTNTSETYDVQLTLSDETEYVLHALPLGDVDDSVQVKVKDDVAYAVYSVKGKKTNTLEEEKALVEASAEEQAVEEAPAEYDAGYAQDYSSDADYGYGYDEGYAADGTDYSYDYSGDGSGYDTAYDYSYDNSYDYSYDAGTQTEDGCVDDIVLR